MIENERVQKQTIYPQFAFWGELSETAVRVAGPTPPRIESYSSSSSLPSSSSSEGEREDFDFDLAVVRLA